jgi:glycosyltransferase involved in cell wall biosynthesis
LKIIFLIRSLYSGGAERQLVVLSKGLSERGHDVVVAIFYSGGPLEKELWNTRVRVRALNKQGRWDVFGLMSEVTKVVREERPDILHGYGFDQNLIGTTLMPLFPRMRVVWGLRCSNLPHEDWLTRLGMKLNCWLSRFPDAIIANSHAGRKYHVAVGYPAEKVVVIPNGIDTEHFHPDLMARGRIRSEWGISEHEKLIGLVSRLDPMKDHPTFLQAAALLTNARKDTRFVCVGGGPADYRATLQNFAKKLGLEERLLWVDTREDMPDVYNALDIAVSSSYAEGLSNVICEAMACGVPCVVTDVGDSAWVVGNTGEVVPCENPSALMNAIGRLLDQKVCEPAQIRGRIVEQLSLNNLVTNTEHVLSAVLKGSASNELGNLSEHSAHLIKGVSKS